MAKLINMTGQRFGSLVVIERDENKGKSVMWKCQCDCGKQTVVESRRLRSGNTRSCGCLIKESNSKNYTIDITGQKFGLLTVIGKGARLGSTEEVCWDCICECGQKTTVRGSELRKGIIQTCGCKRMSHGEIKIRQLLESNQIPYEYEKAFDSCDSLVELILPAKLSSIGDEAFKGAIKMSSITISESVKTIGSNAFEDCSNIETVTFSNSLETIGDYAFSGCSKIKELKLPSSLKTIGNYAFQNCSSITELVIPDSVTSISMGAFKGMNSLVEITIPFVGKSIGSTSDSSNGYGVFGYIFGETNANVEGTTYQDFNRLYASYEYFYIPKTLRTVTITQESKLDVAAFYNCSFLTEINIPETVTSMSWPEKIAATTSSTVLP